MTTATDLKLMYMAAGVTAAEAEAFEQALADFAASCTVGTPERPALAMTPDEWELVAEGLETMAASYDVEADAMDQDGDDSTEVRRLSKLAEALQVRVRGVTP